MATPRVRSSFRLEGTEQVLKNIAENNEEIMEIAMDAVDEALDILLESMKEDCPVGEEVDDEYGRLIDSIHKEKPVKKKRVIRGYVKASKPTAIHVEFGTSKMLPRVFMRTQIQKVRNKVRNHIKKRIKEGVGA